MRVLNPIIASLFVALPSTALAQFVNGTRSEPFVQIANIPGIQNITPLTFNSADDGQVTIDPLPFTYDFLGTSQTRVNLGSNGYLTFGTEPATTYTNQVLGTNGQPNVLIASLWDDLIHPSTANARWGVLGTAPNRIVVIEAGPCSHFGSSGGTLYYQFWLHESTGIFEYRSTGNPIGGLNATIGYEGVNANPFFDALGCGANCTVVPDGTTFFTQRADRPELRGGFGAFPRGAFPGTTSAPGDIQLFNLGVDTATSVLSALYLSADNMLDANDPMVAAIGPTDVTGGGAPLSIPTPVPVPAGTAAGLYFLILEVDVDAQWSEANELDNVTVSALPFATAYELSATDVRPQAAAVSAGDPIGVALDIVNSGVPFTGNVMVSVYASRDDTLDAGDAELVSTMAPLTGPAAETVTVNGTIPANLAPGAYQAILVVDTNGAVVELDEANNTIAGMIGFTVGPDFDVDSVSLQPQVEPGMALPITTRIRSLGAPFTGSVSYDLVASVDAFASSNDTALGSFTVAFTGNAFIDDMQSIVWPASLPPGRYYVIATVDPGAAIAEIDETNNAMASFTTLINGADFVITGPVSFTPAIVEVGDNISVSAQLSSVGLAFTGDVPYRVYLSVNATFDLADTQIGEGVVSVAGNGTVPLTTTATIPGSIMAREHFVLVVANPAGGVAEADTTNNGLASPNRITILGADLRVGMITGTSTAFSDLPYTIELTLENVGVADARAFRYAYYISDNPTIRLTDTQIFVSNTASIAAGGTSVFTDQVTLPPIGSSRMVYIGVIVDLFSEVAEVSEVNNIAAIPGVELIVRLPNVHVEITDTGTITVDAGDPISLTHTAENDGTLDAAGVLFNWYLSKNPTVTRDDISLGTFMLDLAAGASATDTTSLQIPADIEGGTYYVGLIADPDELLDEGNETDNTAVGPPIVVIQRAVRIVTTALPNATLGAPYEAALTAFGGEDAITWAVSAGALPAGLSLDPTGIISGTPTELGPANFTVRASAGDASDEAMLSILVDTETELGIATIDLPAGMIGLAYSATLMGAGGISPYGWSTTGALPAGISLSADGTISGTPTEAGAFPFQVTLTDAVGRSVSQPLVLFIAATPEEMMMMMEEEGGCGCSTTSSTPAANGLWSIALGALLVIARRAGRGSRRR